MDFVIADTFTDSLARLTGDEQKAVKTTAFDLQMNPAGGPGMQFHKLEKAKDKNFWSVRVNRDVRLIVHRTRESLLLCYVDHHDPAYQWAERRRLETHPKTGAAQWVEIRERIEEVLVPRYVDVQLPSPAKPSIFAATSADDLLTCGVPLEWIDDVKRATEDSLLDLVGHLPSEAAEALVDLATGAVPAKLRREAQEEERAALAEFVAEPRQAYGASEVGLPEPYVPDPEAFDHPDARRRFRTVVNVEELERALDAPWEKWTIFLHPAQRESIERDYGGPARVSGSAGTGKTVVALHRAVFLARKHEESRVLLATFSEALASALRIKVRRLIGNQPRLGERLEVHSIRAIARRLHELNLGRPEVASRDQVRQLLEDAAKGTEGGKFSLHFLLTEWEDVVDAWQLETWPAYRDVARLGRKTRLPEKQRQILWSVFESVRAELKARGLVTDADLFSRVAAHLATLKQPPFEFVVVDEAQDVSVAELRFLAALGAGRANSLFFAGDLGQRIFQQPFSWKALGVDVRGRSRTLRINYRTSHQIRARSDRLLAAELSDVDGNTEDRRGAISVFNGLEPSIVVAETAEAEKETVANWLADRAREGVNPHEMAVFVRSPAELDRARAVVERAGLAYKLLDDTVQMASGFVSISTMHLAKGLEFRTVAVMACDDEIIPLQQRIELVTDDSDLEEVYATERHLLYVACTRARDHLLVTGAAPASEFLDDLRS